MSILVVLVFAIPLFAQKDVTKFMGIPVDGFKPAMIQKLKGKGFTSSAIDKNILEGEFNGTQVNVYVATNNNKVYRIMLCDAQQLGKTDIKIRFNKLCQQFQNNSNYIGLGDYMISDDEDIAYELSVHDKRYEAIFYQKPSAIDSVTISDKIKTYFAENYTQEELANPSEELRSEMVDKAFQTAFEIIKNKPIWFMISEYLGQYYITMFYDNEYNKANGEDL